MEYQNPEIPEGINVSREHPLKEFLWLGVSAVLLALALVVGLGWLGSQAARFVPFSAEASISESVEWAEPTPVTAYLRELAADLAKAQDLPEDMPITVHYLDEEVVNAFATLGGNILIYRGLLEKLPHENALAMVLAHEIAHIRDRHPITGLGRGVAVGLVIATLGGATDNAMVSNTLFGTTGQLTALHFSRDQERAADRLALKSVAQHYGHVQGAEALFQLLLRESEELGFEQPSFFSSHPLNQDRIDAIEQWARDHGLPLEGKTTPLPQVVRDALAEK